MSETAETHRRAVRAVLGLLRTRGFDYEPFGSRPRERIRVTSYRGNRLPMTIGLMVHGSTQPSSEAVLASVDDRPLKGEMVVCCWLEQRQFLFLTNDEALQLWHMSGTRAFYGTNDKPLAPDIESVLKILRVVAP